MTWHLGARLGALCVVFAVLACAGCGSSGSRNAKITITAPADGAELANDDDRDPDMPGMQYDVRAESDNIKAGTVVLLQFEDDEETSFTAEVDDNGDMVFDDATLPPGAHTLMVATATGSVTSEPAKYTFKTLVIEAPKAGGIAFGDDTDKNTDGLQINVRVRAYAVEGGEAVTLEVDGKKVGDSVTPDDEGIALFRGVTLSSGDHTLKATAGDVESAETKVDVNEECASVQFLTPEVPENEDRISLGGNSCPDNGEEFTTTVKISTDAGDGRDVELTVNGVPFGTTAKVQGSIATFEDVVLNRRNSSNELSVSVMGAQGVTCPPKEFPAKIFVDCDGADCGIGSPIPYSGKNAANESTLYLNRSARSGNGFDIRVDSDTSVLNEKIQLIVDGRDGDNALSADPKPNGNKVSATFTEVRLSEGEHEIQARCTDSAGNITTSGTLTWVVDTQACGVTIGSPAADTTFSDNDDADSSKAGLQAEVEYSIDGDDCVQHRAAPCNPDTGIPGPDWSDYSGSSVMTDVTLADEEEQRICAEARDRANNVGIDDVAVKNGIDVQDMPVLTIDSPAENAVLSPPAACTPAAPDASKYGVQFGLTLDKAEQRILSYKVGSGSDVPVTVSGTTLTVCVPADEGANAIEFTLASSITSSVDRETRHVTVVTMPPQNPIGGLTFTLPAPTDAAYRDGAVTMTWTAPPTQAGLTSYEIRCASRPLDAGDTDVLKDAWWTNTGDVVTPTQPVVPPANSAQVVFRVGEERHCVVRGRDAANQYTPWTGVGSVSAEYKFREATLVATGDRRMGANLTQVGDVNGDGVTDLLAGGEDGAFLYFGGSTPGTAPSVTFVPTEHYMTETQYAFGVRTAALGDFNGDTRPDFAIAYPGWQPVAIGPPTSRVGRVFVFYGRASTDPWPASPISLENDAICQADVCFSGPTPGDRLGRSIAPIGDFDNDGSLDFAMGAPRDTGAGRVYVALGRAYEGTGGTRAANGFWNINVPVDASGTFQGFTIVGAEAPVPADPLAWRLGVAVAPLGNVDGTDGTDVAISATGRVASGPTTAVAAKVFRLSGRPHSTPGLTTIPSTELSLLAEEPGLISRFGVRLGSFRNFYNLAPQTGVVDLAVYVDAFDEFYVYLGDDGFSRANRINVLGPSSTLFANSGAASSTTYNPNLPTQVGDIDGDGLDDIAVGVEHAQGMAGVPGPAYFFYSSVVQNRLVQAASGGVPDDRIDALFSSRLNPTAPTGTVERTVQLIGDINGDGELDLAIGDPGGGSGAGGITLLY